MKKVVLSVVIVLSMIIMQSGPVFSEDKAGDVFDLGDVLVSEKGVEANPATTVSIVSVEDIDRMGSANVAEALEQIPGIDIQMGSKGHANLKLRGFDQEDVKVLIDGVPAHESYFGSLDLDQISVDSVARIEVTKGASSVLYGANTMGGVINIITKKGGDKPVTSLTTSFGENSTRNYILNHGASFGKLNYWITGSYRTTAGFELSDDFDQNNTETGTDSDYNENGGVRDLSDSIKRTINAKVGYEHDDSSKLYLSFDYHNNEKSCPTGSGRYWHFNEWNQWHLNLVGEHDVTDILTMRTRVFYVDHVDTLEDVSWDADHTTGRKWFEESSFDDFSAGGEILSAIDFGKWSQLKIGMNYLLDNHKQQDYLDAESFGVIRGWDTAGTQAEEAFESATYTLAVEDEIKPNEKLSLTLGLSYDVNDPKKASGEEVPDRIDTFNPQAGVVYKASDSFSLHASAGKKTRFPQLIELFSEQAGGNPDLDPQKTIAYEVGVSKKVKNILKSSVAVFYNDIEDKIDKWENPDTEEDIFVNIGESEILGVEVVLGLIAFDSIKANLNYTWLKAEEKVDSSSDEIDSPNTPDHKVNLDLGYKFNFGLSTDLQATYTGDQVDYDRDGNKIKIDDFYIVNAKLTQSLTRLTKIKSSLFIEGKNILDENYHEGSGPQPGRSILAGANVTF